MKTLFSKEDIERYSKQTYRCMDKCMIEICGNVDENDRCELITDFEEDAVYTLRFSGGFDCLSYRLKIKGKIVVPFIHKLPPVL